MRKILSKTLSLVLTTLMIVVVAFAPLVDSDPAQMEAVIPSDLGADSLLSRELTQADATHAGATTGRAGRQFQHEIAVRIRSPDRWISAMKTGENCFHARDQNEKAFS